MDALWAWLTTCNCAGGSPGVIDNVMFKHVTDVSEEIANCYGCKGKVHAWLAGGNVYRHHVTEGKYFHQVYLVVNTIGYCTSS